METQFSTDSTKIIGLEAFLLELKKILLSGLFHSHLNASEALSERLISKPSLILWRQK